MASMACLQVLNRKRSSSLRIQMLMYRLCTLVLATGWHLTYVSTNVNPADRPSRQARVRNIWAKATRVQDRTRQDRKANRKTLGLF